MQNKKIRRPNVDNNSYNSGICGTCCCRSATTCPPVYATLCHRRDPTPEAEDPSSYILSGTILTRCLLVPSIVVRWRGTGIDRTRMTANIEWCGMSSVSQHSVSETPRKGLTPFVTKRMDRASRRRGSNETYFIVLFINENQSNSPFYQIKFTTTCLLSLRNQI